MADPQPVLNEIIDTLKSQKQAVERNIELVKSRNKILESIVPIDKELLIKEKEMVRENLKVVLHFILEKVERLLQEKDY